MINFSRTIIHSIGASGFHTHYWDFVTGILRVIGIDNFSGLIECLYDREFVIHYIISLYWEIRRWKNCLEGLIRYLYLLIVDRC